MGNPLPLDCCVCVCLKEKIGYYCGSVHCTWIGIVSGKELIDPGIQVIEIHAIHVLFQFDVIVTAHIFSFLLHFPLEYWLHISSWAKQREKSNSQ